LKEILYTILVLSWGIAFIATLVKAQRAQTGFRRAYRAKYPDAPPFPGQTPFPGERRGFKHLDPRAAWAWRRIENRPLLIHRLSNYGNERVARTK